jgi:hypothetical protein
MSAHLTYWTKDRMDAPAIIKSADETQVVSGAGALLSLLNNFSFHVLAALLGIVRAMM